MQRWVVLGASKGLGKALSLELSKTKSSQDLELLLVSRKAELLREVAIQCGPHAKIRSFDFTRREHQLELLKALEDYAPTHLAYLAGGGPHGAYGKRAYSAHRWSLELTFLFPTQLVHHAITILQPLGLKQMILVGSSEAEDQPYPLAASYAAAKHGLFGLIRSIHAEGSDSADVDLRLLSLKDDASRHPAETATILMEWSSNSEAPFHLTC